MELQAKLNVWLKHNFPNATTDQQLKGVMEELGELCHADLKYEQRIRDYSSEKSVLEIEDAVGDLVICLINYCNKKNISFAECVRTAHNEIMSRDWQKNPKDGK